MTQAKRITEAFEAIAFDMAALEKALNYSPSDASDPARFIFPVNPVKLLPPDHAEPLPPSLQKTYPTKPQKNGTPIDLSLSCYGLNSFDLALTDNLDIYTDNSLNTAIVISLFTDRYDPESQQGGYWGDERTTNQTLMGSRLWLLKGAKVTTDALRSAEDYAIESLNWLIDDALATSVNAAAHWEYKDNKHWLMLNIEVVPDPNGRFADQHYRESFSVASQ